MSKKYFIMNNRENPHDGYKKVSAEFVKNYIKSFPEGERAYFINLGHSIMETNKTEYEKFYKEYRRKRYVDEEAHRAGIVSLNAIDSDELDGTGVVADTCFIYLKRYSSRWEPLYFILLKIKKQ